MKTYWVWIHIPVEGRAGLMFCGEDLDEAIDVYEECRIEALSGINPSNVLLYDEKDNQLARTDYSWTGKIPL